MAMSAGQAEGEPMMDMNTTPLIDVMLVLLIMFIMTIPIQTHAVKIDLPPPNPTPPPPVKPTVNTVSVQKSGAILWNGLPLTESQLRENLNTAAAKVPEPELHFQPFPDARYEMVDKVMADIKRSPVTKMGFVGNENYYNF